MHAYHVKLSNEKCACVSQTFTFSSSFRNSYESKTIYRFICGKMSKLEEHSMTDIANEFRIANRVLIFLWKIFYERCKTVVLADQKKLLQI